MFSYRFDYSSPIILITLSIESVMHSTTNKCNFVSLFDTQLGKILSSCAILVFLYSCISKRQFQINPETHEHRSAQKNDTSEVILIHCEKIDIQFFVFPFSDTHFCIQIQTRLSYARPVLGFAHSIVSQQRFKLFFFHCSI